MKTTSKYIPWPHYLAYIWFVNYFNNFISHSWMKWSRKLTIKCEVDITGNIIFSSFRLNKLPRQEKHAMECMCKKIKQKKLLCIYTYSCFTINSLLLCHIKYWFPYFFPFFSVCFVYFISVYMWMYSAASHVIPSHYILCRKTGENFIFPQLFSCFLRL